MSSDLPFWKTKCLNELNKEEWEALCDGCGKCCVNVLEDADTGELYQTNVSCFMLDHESCRCKDYANRKKHVPGCVKLTADGIKDMDWLPPTCAYRLVAEGKDLPEWHYLRCGDPKQIHRLGHSVRGKVISELDVNDLEDHIIARF